MEATAGAGERVAGRASALLSLLFGLWGLAFAVGPFAIGGAGAAAFGVLLGLLALQMHAPGRWRQVAKAGVAVAVIALVAAAIFLAVALALDR